MGGVGGKGGRGGWVGWWWGDGRPEGRRRRRAAVGRLPRRAAALCGGVALARRRRGSVGVRLSSRQRAPPGLGPRQSRANRSHPHLNRQPPRTVTASTSIAVTSLTRSRICPVPRPLLAHCPLDHQPSNRGAAAGGFHQPPINQIHPQHPNSHFRYSTSSPTPLARQAADHNHSHRGWVWSAAQSGPKARWGAKWLRTTRLYPCSQPLPQT